MLCQDVRQELLPHMLLTIRVMDSPSETVGPQLTFSSISYHGHGALHSSRKVAKTEGEELSSVVKQETKR